MPEKKYKVRAECTLRVCGKISRLSPEILRSKFIGNEEEIDIPCPLCGKKVKGEVEEKEDRISI